MGEPVRLGVSAMDADHEKLIAAMNEVHDLDGKNAGKATVDAAITKLAQLIMGVDRKYAAHGKPVRV